MHKALSHREGTGGARGASASIVDKQKWECICFKVSVHFTQLNVLLVKPKNNCIRPPMPTLLGQLQILINSHLN